MSDHWGSLEWILTSCHAVLLDLLFCVPHAALHHALLPSSRKVWERLFGCLLFWRGLELGEKLHKRSDEQRVFRKVYIDEREHICEKRKLLCSYHPVQDGGHYFLFEGMLTVNNVLDHVVEGLPRQG